MKILLTISLLINGFFFYCIYYAAKESRKKEAKQKHKVADAIRTLEDALEQAYKDRCTMPFGGGRVHQEKSLQEQLKEAEEKGEYERCAQLLKQINKS